MYMYSMWNSTWYIRLWNILLTDILIGLLLIGSTIKAWWSAPIKAWVVNIFGAWDRTMSNSKPISRVWGSPDICQLLLVQSVNLAASFCAGGFLEVIEKTTDSEDTWDLGPNRKRRRGCWPDYMCLLASARGGRILADRQVLAVLEAIRQGDTLPVDDHI